MTSAQVEKIITNCVECNYLKKAMNKFTCNHLICKECLCLLLVEHEFNYTKNCSDIVLACPECEPTVKNPEEAPTLKLTQAQLKNLFSSANAINAPLLCIKHSKDIKYFCESCNSEFCEECKSNDKEHENSQIEIDEIKKDAAEKLLLNQCLNLDQIKQKINENKSKIDSEITQSLAQTKEKIKSAITELNNLLVEVEKKSKENKKYVSEFFDMLTFTYEKYYSMIIYEKKLGKDNKITFNVLKKEVDKKTIGTALLNLSQSYFVVGYDVGLIKIWRTEDFLVDKIFTGHTGQIRKMVKQDDNTIISCSDDASIKAWSLDSYEADCAYTLSGHEDKINDILLLESYNNMLISVSDDRTMRFWNLETKECDNAIKTEDIQTSLGKLRNGKFMVGGEDGSVTVFNIEGFEPILSITAHTEPVELLYESPFTGDIITGSQDNLVKMFNVDNGTCNKILEGHKNTILNIAQLDENNILTASVDKTLKIWLI